MYKQNETYYFCGWIVCVLALILLSSVSDAAAIRRNGKIVFTSDRDGNREIYVMNADGSNQLRLTNNSIVDDHPMWSPDGKKIAFVSERVSGGRAIFIINADGTDRTEVTPASYFDRYPNWFFIWEDFYSMDWSPDNSRIVFQDNYNIVIVNANGSNRHAITDATAYDLEPSWSPDGSKILFSKDPIDDGGLQYGRLSTMNVDGTSNHFLSQGWLYQAYAPRWSPAGNKILYVIEFTDDWPTSVINVSNADGSDPQLFDGRTDIYEYQYRNKPSWSPDGNKILFDKLVYKPNQPGDIEIYVKNINGTGSQQITDTIGWNFNPSWQSLTTAPYDFDGDGKSDISIFRPSVGEWWYRKSSDGQTRAGQFGSSSDVITPGDFTGDGKTDLAFFRPAEGRWYVLRSDNDSYFAIQFGQAGDIPMPADFDGDGKTDAAVFRPSEGLWFILRSSDTGVTFAQFGTVGDQPVAADYDGDGKADIAIVRNISGNIRQWWIQRTTLGIAVLNFGVTGDITVPGDYTGDGKADVAVFHPNSGQTPSEWYILRSEDFSYFSFPWGQNGDVPVPADYDGDGKFEAGVFRPSDQTWYINQTIGGPLFTQFGLGTDQPVPSLYNR